MTERFVSKFSQIRGFEIPVLRDGVPSFLAVPMARTPAELAGADAAIIGVPYDRPATAGRGAPADVWIGGRNAGAARHAHVPRLGAVGEPSGAQRQHRGQKGKPEMSGRAEKHRGSSWSYANFD